jgi:hypothetical protein
MYHVENRGVGADAEGEREDGDSGEARGFPQHAQGVADVPGRGFEEVHAARLAAFLFELIDSAEFETSAAASFQERQAGLNELFDLLVEVKAQFVVEFVFDGTTPEQGTQANQDVTEHVPLPEGSNAGTP